MGLISAGVKSVTGTLKDQWKDYFYCDALRLRKPETKGRAMTISLQMAQL